LYETITQSLVNDGYIIIKNTFNSNLPKNLLEFASSEIDFKEAGISSASDLHLDKQRRRDKIHWLDEDGDSQSEFLAFTKGLQEYLNKELYLGLS